MATRHCGDHFLTRKHRITVMHTRGGTNGTQRLRCYRGSTSRAVRAALTGSFPGTTLSFSASSPTALSSVWASGLCPHLFCAPASKLCPKIPEKPKRAHRSVTLSINLDTIKYIWYNWVGYFLDLGTLKTFPYKLVGTASLFYTILAYKTFHGDTRLR